MEAGNVGPGMLGGGGGGSSQAESTGNSEGGNTGAGAQTSSGPARGEAGASAHAQSLKQPEGGQQAKPQAPAQSKPQAPKAPPAQTQAEFHEVSVNGKNVKMTTKELIQHAQKSYAADQKFNEAATLRKQIQEVENLMKTDMFGALKKAGFSDKEINNKFEEHYYKNVVEPTTLSPQELAHRKDLAELEQFRSEKTQREQESQRADQEAHSTKVTEMSSQQIVQAMENSNLPRMPFFAQQMAFYMLQNHENGYDAPMEMISNQVKAEFQNTCQQFGSKATAEQIIETFGPELIQKIRAYDLQQFRSKRSQPRQETQSYSTQQGENKKVNYSEMIKKLRGL